MISTLPSMSSSIPTPRWLFPSESKPSSPTTGLLSSRIVVRLLCGDVTLLRGVVDSSYRGEWKLVLWNLSDEPIGFLTGEKIAQFVLTPIINNLQPKQGKVSESDRGSGGFGSSGR